MNAKTIFRGSYMSRAQELATAEAADREGRRKATSDVRKAYVEGAFGEGTDHLSRLAQVGFDLDTPLDVVGIELPPETVASFGGDAE